MGFGTKIAAGIDMLLHTAGVIVVLAVAFDFIDMPVSWVIAAIVVMLVGVPYPGLHGVWEDE